MSIAKQGLIPLKFEEKLAEKFQYINKLLKNLILIIRYTKYVCFIKILRFTKYLIIVKF